MAEPVVDGNVKFIRGTALKIFSDERSGLKLMYSNDERMIEHTSGFDIVINCTGSSSFSENSSSPLIRSLIENMGIEPTPSERGLLVDDNFSAHQICMLTATSFWKCCWRTVHLARRALWENYEFQQRNSSEYCNESLR